jgi:integrase
MAANKAVKPGIYQRGTGQFQVKVRENGVSMTRTFETLAQAEAWQKVVKGKVADDEFVDRTREKTTKLYVILQRYLDEVTAHKRKGRKQEADRLRQWLRDPLADRALASIESADIAAWRKARIAAGQAADEKRAAARKAAEAGRLAARVPKVGWAPTTISNMMNLLSKVFKHARTEWGFKIDNPCMQVARPNANPAREAVLTEAEKRLLIEACAERGPVWLPFIVRLAIGTGMRQGELRRLRWRLVHEMHLHLPETKNGARRDVPLTSAAAQIIAEMRTALPPRVDGWVFGDPDAPAEQGGFTEHQVGYAFRQVVAWLVANHGFPKITLHDLRHVGTTELSELADNVLELAQITGHKTLNTLKRYFNTKPADRAMKMRAKEAARAAGAIRLAG